MPSSEGGDGLDPELVAAAEAQMCRPAPKRLGGDSEADVVRDPKRSRVAGGETSRGIPAHYKGISALFKGYLVMCGFRRQNSALREAVDMLEPYLDQGGGCKIKLASLRVACEGVLLLRAYVETAAAADSAASLPLQEAAADVLESFDPATPLAALIKDVYGGDRPTSKWCQRVIPIMRTCPMKLTDIESTAREMLAASTLPGTGSTAMRFAVSVKLRASSLGADVVPRGELIGVLAAALCEEAGRQHPSSPTAVVDLSTPQILFMAQQLPVRSTAGILGDERSDVCALSILTTELLVYKPHPTVKGLTDESVKAKPVAKGTKGAKGAKGAQGASTAAPSTSL